MNAPRPDDPADDVTFDGDSDRYSDADSDADGDDVAPETVSDGDVAVCDAPRSEFIEREPSRPPEPSRPTSPLPAGDTLADQGPQVVLRRSARQRQRRALGARGAAAIVLAAIVPIVVTAALLWPQNAARSESAAGPTAANTAPPPPLPDFAALRAAVELWKPEHLDDERAAASSAFDAEPLEKARSLARILRKARAARRDAGADVAALRRPFTIEEMGGTAALDALGMSPHRRLLLTRDAKVVWPIGVSIPMTAEGRDLVSRELDEDLLECDGLDNDKPVRLFRRCLPGEVVCLLDITESPSASRSSTRTDPRAALLARIDAEQARAERWSQAARASTPAAMTSDTADIAAAASGPEPVVPPGVALVVGLGLALALAWPGARKLLDVGTLVMAEADRLRAAVAGRAASRTATDVHVSAELAALRRAIDDACLAFEESERQRERERHRSARASALAEALDEARLGVRARIDVHVGDDPALANVEAAARRAVEAFHAHVIRWRSHADVLHAAPGREQVALDALRKELAELSPQLGELASRPTTLAALRGLPAPEIAARLTAPREEA